MKTVVAILGGLLVWSDVASARPADCLLEIDGKTYIQGICEFRPEANGAFQISSKYHAARIRPFGSDGGDAYAGKASASWTGGDPDSTHLQALIGEDFVSLSKWCWKGGRGTVCAREFSPGRLAEWEAARPSGDGIEVYVAGYPDVCTAGFRYAIGTPLIIGYSDCRGEAGELPRQFHVTADNILIDKHPGLCIDVEAPDADAGSALVLKDCDAVSNRWKLFEGVIRSTSRDLCWGWSDEDHGDAQWKLLAVPCHGVVERNRRFTILWAE